MDPLMDPADELRDAQRRHRRRMLVVVGAVAIAAGAFAVLVAMCTGGGRLLPPISKPFLYEVSGPQAPQPSYLFGTMHIAYSLRDLPRSVLAAQDKAATSVFESDLEAREAATAAPSPAAPPTPPTNDGRRRLDDAEWAKLSKMTGVPESRLEGETTSHLLGAALVSMLPSVEAMDRALQKRAAAAGKQLAFLETRNLEQVMNGGTGGDSSENPEILDGLRNAIQHRGAFRAELLKIARRYADGDERGCAGNLGELTSGLNDVWITKIEENIRRGNAFIAIGCGHLAGDGSIVERLEARGFTVRRITQVK
jgi:uncharacterized protein YbaP (TraB family)